MNARCYDGEISQIFLWADAVDETGNLIRLPYREEEWSYKRSPFQDRNLVLLRAAFRLTPGDPDDLVRIMADHRADREKKGHFRRPCAGSVFKNDRRFGRPSGRIIDECGLKGLRVGDAAVAPWHGNIIINDGNARAGDIRALMERVRREVRDRTGFDLEPEVLLAGDWGEN